MLLNLYMMSLNLLPAELIECIAYHSTWTCFALADPVYWDILMTPRFIELMRNRWDGQAMECPNGFQLLFQWAPCWCCQNYIDLQTDTSCLSVECPFWFCTCDWHYMLEHLPPTSEEGGYFYYFTSSLDLARSFL